MLRRETRAAPPPGAGARSARITSENAPVAVAFEVANPSLEVVDIRSLGEPGLGFPLVLLPEPAVEVREEIVGPRDLEVHAPELAPPHTLADAAQETRTRLRGGSRRQGRCTNSA